LKVARFSKLFSFKSIWRSL